MVFVILNVIVVVATFQWKIGPVYQGISAHTCDKSTLSYMSNNLYILDPVYGVLRSLDTMQPYRLEMGVKGIVANDDSNKKGKK